MTGIELWNTTAASNNSAAPNGAPEGMAPSAVNDTMRQMMAAIRSWYEDAQWIKWGDTTTYVAATQFKIASSDVTARYLVGRRVRAVGASTGTIYGAITASAFSTDTTVTVLWDSGSLSNETLTISIGILGAVGDVLSSICVRGTATVTITIASPGVVTYTAHGLTGVQPIVFTTSGTLPTGIVAGTQYWTIPSSITANTFQIATSIANAIAGTAINTSGSQSGTQTGTIGATMSTASITDITALSLAAGEWDVWGGIDTNPTGLATAYGTGISTVSGSLALSTSQSYISGVTFASASQQRLQAQLTQIKLTVTTTVYLEAYAVFSTGAMVTGGSIYARRIRQP